MCATRRAMYRAAGRYVRRYHEHRVRDARAPFVGATETCDELLARARREIEHLRWQLRHGYHPVPDFERRRVLFEVGFLRRAAMERAPAPSNRAFYVTTRDGARHGLLYGPFVSQRAALRTVDAVRSAAQGVHNADAAFASFGTASLPLGDAVPGLLNDWLPPIAASDAVPIVALRSVA